MLKSFRPGIFDALDNVVDLIYLEASDVRPDTSFRIRTDHDIFGIQDELKSENRLGVVFGWDRGI